MMASIIPQLKNIGKSATLQINEASSNLEKKGRKVYRFGFGQSPFPVPAYNLKKLHKAVKNQMPKPKNGFLDAYKEILPAIFKQAYDPNYRLEVKLPNI